jgi:GNAT superfamily N-acetyltransferase
LSEAVEIRSAASADVPLLYSMIVGLAEYERAPEKVTGTAAMLDQALFGPTPSAEAVIAESDGQPVGFALFHSTFSTWECRPGIWLEDLFVPPEHRRAGVGGALLSYLAQVTIDRGCARLEWTALDWNAPALNFYAKLGAEVLAEWTTHRLDGAALAGVASGASSGS